jgi:hypothetical protein
MAMSFSSVTSAAKSEGEQRSNEKKKNKSALKRGRSRVMIPAPVLVFVCHFDSHLYYTHIFV